MSDILIAPRVKRHVPFEGPSTPGDPPCVPGIHPLWPGGPCLPRWIELENVHEVMTSEYPNWGVSRAQAYELAALGLPEPASWVEADIALRRARAGKARLHRRVKGAAA